MLGICGLSTVARPSHARGAISKVSQEFASYVTLARFDDKLRIDRQSGARDKTKAKAPLLRASPMPRHFRATPIM